MIQDAGFHILNISRRIVVVISIHTCHLLPGKVEAAGGNKISERKTDTA